MSNFFWTGEHLGWGIFCLIVFTELWCLLADLVWRLKNVRFRRFIAAASLGWLIAAGLIVAIYLLAIG